MKLLTDIAQKVKAQKGRLRMVGGQVRSAIMGTPPTKDIDVVVFGITREELLDILSNYGRLSEISRRLNPGGEKQWSLIHLRSEDNYYEFSLPRRPLGDGNTVIDPAAGLVEDAMCRDFTINAVYQDPLTNELFDPVGGLADLQNGRLESCHPRYFDADPLRFLRAMAFISRYGFEVSPDLWALCYESGHLLKTVSPDRLWPEWRKWALGAHPHLGLRFLEKSGLIKQFPVLKAVVGVPQNHFYHPEGDVWSHTVETVHVAQNQTHITNPEERVRLLMAALLHDIGKSECTRWLDGAWVSRGHDKIGQYMAEQFLSKMLAPTHLTAAVSKLVGNHMVAVHKEFSRKMIRRLSRRLSPDTDLKLLHALITSDLGGRGVKGKAFMSLEEFAAPLGGQVTPPPPLLLGRDILAAFPQFRPGPQLGEMLKQVEEASDLGLIFTKEDALEFVRRQLSGETCPTGSQLGPQ